MTAPKPLDDFLPKLLADRTIRAACKEVFDVYAPELMSNAQSGDADEFLEWFEDWRTSNSKVVATIEAAAPDDDVFEILVHQTGPVFWIEAPEFDDIGYFDTLAAAESHAESEFGEYIAELEERREAEARAAEEEEEEDDEDDDDDDYDDDDAQDAGGEADAKPDAAGGRGSPSKPAERD